MNKDTKVVTIRMTPQMLDALDQIVNAHKYATRTDIIREAIDKYLAAEIEKETKL